jgi:hypothetical protein
MKIFDRLFNRSPKANEPDNSKLLRLLDIYWKADGKGDTYKNVISELMNGDSFLMLPGQNEFNTGSGGWITTEGAKTIKLALYTLDGLKVLAAFTDEKALLDWSKQPRSYTSMRSQDILKLCEANDIVRIVINNSSPNTFVLERNRSNAKEYTIEANSKVLLGVPQTPLNKSLLNKMVDRFRNLDNIKRTFLYGQTKNDEFSMVLAFDLERNSENGKKAVIDLVRDAIGSEILPNPLDIFFIESEEWRSQIMAIKDVLIYEA